MGLLASGAGLLAATAVIYGCFSSHVEGRDAGGGEDAMPADHTDVPREDDAGDDSAAPDADVDVRDGAPEDAPADTAEESRGDSGDEEASSDADESSSGDAADGEGDAPDCATDVDCAAGLSCLDGRCVFGWTRTGVPGTGLAIDSLGRVHRVGFFDVDTDFDPGPGVDLRAPVGARDGFLLRLDDRGRYLDTRTFSGADPASEIRLQVVDSGPGDEPHVAFIMQAGPMEPLMMTPVDVRVERLSADLSTVEWTAALNAWANFEYTPGVMAVHVTGAGDVFLAGFYFNHLRWGSLPTDEVLGWGEAGFVARLGSSGGIAWVEAQRVSRDTERCDYLSLAVLAGGDLLLGGSCVTTAFVDLDPGLGEYWRVVNGGFLTRLGDDGTYRWAYVLESGTTTPQLAAASAGGLALAGGFRGDTDLDPGPALDVRSSTAGGLDAYVVLFDETFARRWTWTSTSAADDYVIGAADDGAGRVYIVALDGSGCSLMAFTEAGDLLWTRPIPGWVDDLSVRPPYGVHVAGRFSGAADFDPGSGEDYHTAAGTTDTFVTRLTAEGTY